jgi:hypothetical protein
MTGKNPVTSAVNANGRIEKAATSCVAVEAAPSRPTISGTKTPRRVPIVVSTRLDRFRADSGSSIVTIAWAAAN